jgi:hypothetical protein
MPISNIFLNCYQSESQTYYSSRHIVMVDSTEYYLTKSCIYFEDLLEYIISGSYNK